MRILQPFRDQFSWSKPEGNKGPFLKYLTDFFKAVWEDDPFGPALSALIKDYNGDQKKIGVPFFIYKNPALTLFSIVPLALFIAHALSRLFVGFFGALFEYFEGKIENYGNKHPKRAPFLIPAKLFFYLLKQPFKWAETAISAAVHLVDGIFAFGYGLSCAAYLSLTEKKNEDFNYPRGRPRNLRAKDQRAYETARKEMQHRKELCFGGLAEKMGTALARLLIVGAIGAAGYFLGPIGVSALAGTLGVTGAGCAVAGIGTVGVTAVQALGLTIVDRLTYKKKGETAGRGHSDIMKSLHKSKPAESLCDETTTLTALPEATSKKSWTLLSCIRGSSTQRKAGDANNTLNQAGDVDNTLNQAGDDYKP